MKAGPRQAEFVPSEGKTVTFSDVHGVDEVKDVGELTLTSRHHDLMYPQELKDVVAFLKDPTTFATLGGKLPKGILLTGCVCHASGVPQFGYLN